MMPEEEQVFLWRFKEEMMELFSENPEKSFHHLKDAMLDNDELVALWEILPSNVRSAYKKWTRGLK